MTINFHICSVAERQEIVDFLFSIGDELLLSKRSDSEEITDLLFEHGGAIAGYDGDAMVAVLGYFFGEPSRNYANKEVGFVYITGIAKSHRLSRTMWNGMGFVFRHLQEMGVREIRCHASEHDPYTNRLYSHFAKRLGNDVTLRGRPAILYGNTIEGVLAYLDKGKTQVSSRLEPIMQPSRARSVSHHPLVTSPPDGVLWHCSPCDVWWLSQASSSPESWRLERMPEIDFTEGDKLSQHEDKAPAWNVSGPSPLFCPKCGQTMGATTLSASNICTQTESSDDSGESTDARQQPSNQNGPTPSTQPTAQREELVLSTRWERR